MQKKTSPFHTKLKATGIHLLISLFIFVLLVLWIYLDLYPSFYFNMSGGIQGLGFMFGVDVVLGPLLTFLVFNPHKKLREIISDLVIIGLVQLAALGYGLHTVYQEHPKLVIMYQNNVATVLSHREVREDEQLQKINLSQLTHLEGVSLAKYQVVNGKGQFMPLNNVAQDLAQLDVFSRKFIDERNSAALKQLEQQHGKVWMIPVMGKYTGAYIVVDKNLNYLGKIGEKPVS